MITKVGPQLAFGKHYITGDVGASVYEGSFKLSAKDKNGKPIAEESLTVFDKGDQRTEELFEQRAAEKIAEFHERHKAEIVAADPEDESFVVIDYPGPIKATGESNGPALTNFFYEDIRDDEHRFKRPIVGATIDSFLAQMGIKLGSSRHVNDMAAGGASVLKVLKEQYPETLEDGASILFLYPGGGLGSGEIVVDDNNIKIKPTEKQHTYGHVKQADGSYEIEHIERNVQLDGLKRNFGLAAFPGEGKEEAEMRKAIEKEDDGRTIDNYEVFEKYFPGKLTENAWQKASHNTITLYMEALSQIVARQIANTDTKTVVVTGKIANGISKSVAKNPYFEGKTFEEVLKEHTFANLPAVGQNLISKDLGEFKEGLRVIMMPLENNTEGAYMLADAKQVGNPPRWYNIPKNTQPSVTNWEAYVNPEDRSFYQE